MALSVFSVQAQLPKPTYPVIFIHGVDSNSEDSWGDLRRMLVENGWVYGGATRYESARYAAIAAGVPMTSWPDENANGSVKVWKGDPKDRADLKYGSGTAHFYTVNFSSSYDLTFASQGFELGRIVKAVLDANSTSKVILVGHSMGGLAARAYLQKFGTGRPYGHTFSKDVQALVTVGTPHQGSWIETLCEIKRKNLAPVLDTGICIYRHSSGRGSLSLDPRSEELKSLNNSVNLPPEVAYTSVVARWTNHPTLSKVYWDGPDPASGLTGGILRTAKGEDGDGVVTATSQNLALLPSWPANLPTPQVPQVYFPESVPLGCGWHLSPGTSVDEVHTCETQWPAVWDKLLRAVLEIPDPVPDAKPLSDRLDPMVFTGSASRQVVAGGTDQYVISGLAFHPQDAIQVTCEYGPKDSFPLLSSRANSTVAVIQPGAVGSFECRIPTTTLTNAGSTLSVPSYFEMIPFSYRVVATRVAP